MTITLASFWYGYFFFGIVYGFTAVILHAAMQRVQDQAKHIKALSELAERFNKK